MDPVRSFLREVPYPVLTMTSPRFSPVATRMALALVLPPEISTSARPKPTEVITSAVTLGPTDILNVPSAPVEVPLDVPLGTTDAPATGDPSLESVTFPVTVLSWALAI